jgi:hypothetical protein
VDRRAGLVQVVRTMVRSRVTRPVWTLPPFCYCEAARGEARREVPSAVRLPIAALLVWLSWRMQAAAQLPVSAASLVAR